ncbi:MAG: hypothetical protein F8N36_13770 [Desulfovibrio sp.]|uniref:hypothetical protein n=1 Tax=Desulfovibrio sp. TaxID=885 RepID=UPI00135E4963|nr:hypothetical protein [Desulfovibrio sp.]MTJ93906.1 hypothetical protein [Desulfovibrio sp.]
MTAQSYQEYEQFPEYRTGRLPSGALDKSVTEIPKWNSEAPPPAKGSYVHCRINAIGPCIVTGYFTEDGYLGILVKLLDPPAWHIRQQGYNTTAHLFGPEFSMLDQAPEIPGPNIEQLEALQRFAEKYGRTWKSILQSYWMSGRDESEPLGAQLRQVRNSFPGWLYSARNKVVPRDAARRSRAE